MSDFSRNLKRLRKARGYKQEQAARELDASLHAYRNWEQGVNQPPLSALPAIRGMLGCTYDALFEQMRPAADLLEAVGHPACGYRIDMAERLRRQNRALRRELERMRRVAGELAAPGREEAGK